MQNHILSIILFTPHMGALVLLVRLEGENKDAVLLDREFLCARRPSGLATPGARVLGTALAEPGFKFIEGAAGDWIPS